MEYETYETESTYDDLYEKEAKEKVLRNCHFFTEIIRSRLTARQK